MNTSDGEV